MRNQPMYKRLVLSEIEEVAVRKYNSMQNEIGLMM